MGHALGTCCANVCGRASAEPTHEEKLRARQDELSDVLKAAQTQLRDAKMNREQHEQHRNLKRKESEDLQARMHDIKKKNSRRRECCSCFVFFDSSERLESRIASHQKRLEEDLIATQVDRENLEAKRMEMEAKVELVESMEFMREEPPPDVEIVTVESLPFARSGTGLSFFRAHTPRQQREMKSKILELLADLQNTQEELEREQKRQQAAEFDAMHHEVTALALGTELRNQMRIDVGLDHELKRLITGHGNQTHEITKSMRKMFKGETPAKQREMKAQIKTFLAELEKAEHEAAKAHEAHRVLRHKVSQLPGQLPSPLSSPVPNVGGALPRRSEVKFAFGTAAKPSY